MKEKQEEFVTVGNIPLPFEAQAEVSNLIKILGEKYEFKNGETAAYFHLCLTLSQHLGEGKK